MCGKKEDQTGNGQPMYSDRKERDQEMDLPQFMDHLESVILSLPPGTWSLVIHVNAPGRFGLPST